MQNKLLDLVNEPADIRNFSHEELLELANELRCKTIETVSKTGGHLGAGLGVIELTVALHYVFDTPKDLIVWDIGHQTYPHKILTGRKNRISTLRQEGGLSGFTKRDESIYDTFGAGHSSTSISAALGMACARDLKNENKEVIAVIGDGAISAGMAYEAMNNAGSLKSRMIVILNDNDMSISKPVGAMNTYLSKLISSKPYLQFRKSTKSAINMLPNIISRMIKKMESNTKNLLNDCNIFEELGFYYIGPIDGHDLKSLITILSNIKDNKSINRPILLHVITEKGKGFHSPDANSEKFHAVSQFDIETGIQKKSSNTLPSYTNIFADKISELAKTDDKIVAITAAMPSGTGLDKFAGLHPDRFFDVGIAEQHAVTFAAGLACEGFKPFVAIYSTFLQRAYDQVVHDVAIQNLPVRFAIDRAGFVGNDGATHCGAFDIAYLATLPNFVVMVPSDESELSLMITTALSIDDRPSAFRYPRGQITGKVEIEANLKPIEIGKGRMIQHGSKVAVLNLGTRLNEVLEASNLLFSEHQIQITIADARFAKPLDKNLVNQLAQNHQLLIIIEEGSIGGFSAHVLEELANNNLSHLTVKSLHYPDEFYEHSSQERMNVKAGLSKNNIVDIILNFVGIRASIKIVA